MKVLNKLTMKNLCLNKKRTIVTVIGILLSVSLITAVSTLFMSAKESLIVFEKQEKGNYHYAFQGVEKQNLDMFMQNRKIEENYLVEDLGYSRLEESKNEYKPYANVKAFTEEGLHNLGVQLREGRLPENSSEIVIPAHLKTNGRVKMEIGENIVLNLGERMFDGQIVTGNKGLEETGDEEIVNAQERAFTIVGIIDRLPGEIENYTAAGYTFVTCKEAEEMGEVVDVYSRYTKEGLQNHLSVTAALLKVEKEAFETLYDPAECISLEEKEAMELVKQMGEPAYEFWQNGYLITLQTGFLNNSQLNALGTAVCVVILIIIVTSVFCIKNSFDISISEKIRQYGMLSSVGATRKQIKRNVYFEGLILGGMGIPLGIFAGVFASWILVYVCNYFVKDMLGFPMIFAGSWKVLLLSVLLGSVTILLSARKSAVKASKISPIQAIRSSEEIKIRSNKIKAPKYVRKIFGIGGEISYKNLKRSRKKYRTTVISIVMCVAIFIALYSFIDMAFSYIGNTFKQSDYNLSLTYYGTEDIDEKMEEVKDLDGIKTYSHEMYGAIRTKNVDYSKVYESYIQEEIEAGEDSDQELMAIVLDEPSFRAYVKKLNLDYEEVKGQGILFNTAYVYQYDEKKETYRNYQVEKFDYEKGDIISGVVPLKYDENGVLEKSEPIEIEIAKVTDQKPMGDSMNDLILGPAFKEKMDQLEYREQIYIDAEDPDKIQDEAEVIFGDEAEEIYMNNVEENARMMASFYTLLAIFLYGFIIVISLIGVTNIFNTITTNMNLRQREFAMLKSVGMTKQEFHRMIRLESFFYGIKSLVIGIPIGVLLSYLLHCSMNSGETVWQFVFPVRAVLISAGAVFLLIACIMSYSVHKIQKQNIIETIRNENI